MPSITTEQSDTTILVILLILGNLGILRDIKQNSRVGCAHH